MDEVADFEDIGEQFRFLLQPVRDLAKNWDIDIKHYLDDYMKKLSKESESSKELDAQGKRKLFNFAEAAVVIDGSTNIYSRKVDYLLQQAQDCFSMISIRKEEKPKKRKGENEDDAIDDGIGEEMDSDMEDPDERRRRKNPFLNELTTVQEDHMAAQLQKLAKTRPFFPIVPLAFTPYTDYEKTNVVIFNRGEMVGKKDDFKVNTCQILDGVALIDLKNLELLDMFTQLNVDIFHTPSIKSLASTGCESTVLGEYTNVSESNSTALLNLDEFENLENIDPGKHQDHCEQDNRDYFDDFCDDDLASELNDISGVTSTQPKGDLLPMEPTQGTVTSDQNITTHSNFDIFGRLLQPQIRQSQLDDGANNSLQNQYNNSLFEEVGGSQQTDGALSVRNSIEDNALSSMELNNTGYNLRPNSASFRNCEVGSLDRTALANALAEQFELLDPLEYQANEKPFVKNNKCITMAQKQVKQRDRRIERECIARGIPNIPMVKTYMDTRMFSRKIRKRSYAFAQFNSFLTDQALFSLNSQFYEEEKRRTELRKKREVEAKLVRRLARRTSQRTSITHRQSIARGPSLFASVANSPPPNNFEDPSEELGADDIIDCNEPNSVCDPPDERPLGDIISVDDLGEQNFETHYNDNGGRRRSVLMRNENFYDDTIYVDDHVDYPDDLPPRPLSQLEYNELVEYHLKKYWTIKEEATSKFCERVRNWEEKVTPLLEEELTHRQFNTREYSTEIINHFENGLGSELDFLKFAKDSVGYDLSRYLLVSLILTNMQNVKVVESDINQLKLQLLKLERHDEVFDDEQRLITGGG